MTPAQKQEAINKIRPQFSKLVEVFNTTPGSKVDFNFKYTPTDYPIQGVVAFCGCTDATLSEDKTTISGKMDIASADSFAKTNPNQEAANVSKNMRIFFDDGQPFKVIDEKGIIKDNSNKLSVDLSISGNVQLK